MSVCNMVTRPLKFFEFIFSRISNEDEPEFLIPLEMIKKAVKIIPITDSQSKNLSKHEKGLYKFELRFKGTLYRF